MSTSLRKHRLPTPSAGSPEEPHPPTGPAEDLASLIDDDLKLAGLPATALLTPAVICRVLGISASTAARWRSASLGPKWIKLGGGGTNAPVRYLKNELESWIRSRQR